MNSEINYFEQLYQKSAQDPEVLERDAAAYPYSSLANFLLLYHYKKTNHSGFENLSKKTALHFKNANWLQFLLDQTVNAERVTPIVGTAPAVEEKNEESEINSGEIIQPSFFQNPGSEVEELKENAPLEIENVDALPLEEANLIAGEPANVPGVLAEPNISGEHIEEKNIKPAENLPEEIAFEPLHTVDYFASQGIKISDEPETTDKLGNQMKSFTAWLKSMKKLHSSKLQEQDLATENQIQNSAEESNINTEILTEAMAEVLIKQDKREKAIEMYDKLSLINPSKRAYFAAKIESIKSS